MHESKFETFGRLVWDMIQQQGGDFCGDEWSEEVLPLAQKAGLCSRVKYDPEKHGDEIQDAEPGDEIWFWEAVNTSPANIPLERMPRAGE